MIDENENSSKEARQEVDVPTRISSSRILLWAALSIGGLVYIAFGSVDARIWRFNRLRVDSKDILGIWTLQGDRLPSVTFQWILTTAYFAALCVLVAGVIAALWYLLDDADPEQQGPATPADTATVND